MVALASRRAWHWFFNLTGWRLALVLQLRDLAVGAAGRWFFDFLGGGLGFFSNVSQTVGHRGETRRALPCRCQPWVTLTGYFPLQAHVRGPPPPWGASGKFPNGEGGLAVVAPKRCSVGDAMGPALGPPSTPTSAANGHAFGCGLCIGSSTSGMLAGAGPSTSRSSCGCRGALVLRLLW